LENLGKIGGENGKKWENMGKWKKLNLGLLYIFN
jgi:hypothetical protein